MMSKIKLNMINPKKSKNYLKIEEKFFCKMSFESQKS
jgi:hypothetical protein